MKDFVIWMVTIIITNLATGMMMYRIGKRGAIEEVSDALDVLDGLINTLEDGKEHSDGTEET